MGQATKCYILKVGFSKWHPFFDSIYFWTSSAPSGGFLKKEARTFGFHFTANVSVVISLVYIRDPVSAVVQKYFLALLDVSK